MAGARMRRLHPDSVAFTLLLGVIISLQLFGISITLPVLPSITAAFNASAEATQLTISAFLAGIALSQMVYGSLSDRFGRKPVLMGGLALYALAGLGCALAPGVEFLIALRVLQGAGAAASVVITRAIVRDLFEGRRGVQMLSRLGAMTSVVPMLAPLFGGLLLPYVGWRGIFAVLANSSATAMLVAYLLLGESIRERNPSATNLRQLAVNSWRFVTTPGCFAFVMMISFANGATTGYSATSSFVLMTVYGVSASTYGVLLMITGVAMFIGSASAEFIARRWNIRQMLGGITVLGLVSGLGMLVCTQIAVHTGVRGTAAIALIVVPMVFYGLTLGAVYSGATTAALHPVPDIAGVASAVMGSAHMLGASFFVWLGGRLFDGTSTTLGYGIALGGAGSFLAYWMFARRHVPVVH
jgi:DHA1 family bicyclomycin/chloramphenicol resistance-like MFS transporter